MFAFWREDLKAAASLARLDMADLSESRLLDAGAGAATACMGGVGACLPACTTLLVPSLLFFLYTTADHGLFYQATVS